MFCRRFLLFNKTAARRLQFKSHFPTLFCEDYMINKCCKSIFNSRKAISILNLQHIPFVNVLQTRHFSDLNESQFENSELENLLLDKNYKKIYEENLHLSATSHNVCIIQPITWKFKKEKEAASNKAQRMLDESVALINSIPKWLVLKKMILETATLDRQTIWSKQEIKKLKEEIHSHGKVTALFIGVDMMSALQRVTLEDEFGCHVFDRYSVVLRIFKDHAKTQEAKLQLALAEIPYMRQCLSEVMRNRGAITARQAQSLEHIGGPSNRTAFEKRIQMLKDRKVKLQNMLRKLDAHRSLLRRARINQEIPVISVVGYTNSGKTSLIRALTNDPKLKPEDKLFATLDVTVHAGLLPSRTKALFVDTIGFISDIPTSLIASFKSTLKEIIVSNAIVHVIDISNPDWERQRETVFNTLKEIEIPEKLGQTMIEVLNKTDLIENAEDFKNNKNILVSTTEGIGLNALLDEVEKAVISNTGRLRKVLRVPNGGPEYDWLCNTTGVKRCEADPKDSNFLLIEVLITEANYSRFRHFFRKSS